MMNSRTCLAVRSWTPLLATVAIFGFATNRINAQIPLTFQISVSSSGQEGNDDSRSQDLLGSPISADGHLVAFASVASNLVPGDTNGTWDVFVRDWSKGTTERVSVSSSGQQGNGASGYRGGLSIRADGRFVAFASAADNLVPGDANIRVDVFVRDRLLGTTELVSVSSLGHQGNGISAYPSMSADGRFVAFASLATNLVPNSGPFTYNVFVHDRLTQTTELVSVSTDGVSGNGLSAYLCISADGRFVAFASLADNLISGDTNIAYDVFVRDRLVGSTELASVSSSGLHGNGDSGHFGLSISADGRFVAFTSSATNFIAGDANLSADVFVRDRLAGTTELASVSSTGEQGNLNGYWPSISADGRFVAFMGDSTNLVPGDTNGSLDGFVRDRLKGRTERVSVSSVGVQGNSDTVQTAISADGSYATFWGSASNLVPGDTNGRYDVFIRATSRGHVMPVAGPQPKHGG